jgi:tryptophan 2,3-dioxygenase
VTYGSYLRVPELLSLQTPLGEPPVPGEMLFIILQQAQELWFKQILFDLRRVIGDLTDGDILTAVRTLGRVNHILRVLADEVEIMGELPPVEFHAFRHRLKTASGFESEQFREVELASGLADEMFLRLASKIVDLAEVRRRWPLTLRGAFLDALRRVSDDRVGALVTIYSAPDRYPDLYLLAEAVTVYENRFAGWRFAHMRMVERVIGDLAPGTGGSPGSAYLGRTLAYRLLPELWEAKNRLTAGSRADATAQET